MRVFCFEARSSATAIMARECFSHCIAELCTQNDPTRGRASNWYGVDEKDFRQGSRAAVRGTDIREGEVIASLAKRKMHSRNGASRTIRVLVLVVAQSAAGLTSSARVPDTKELRLEQCAGSTRQTHGRLLPFITGERDKYVLGPYL